jgi:hypothetical protein
LYARPRAALMTAERMVFTMKAAFPRRPDRTGQLVHAVAVLGLCAALHSGAYAQLQVEVTDPQGNPVSGFRWLVEEDNTNQPIPGTFQPISGEPGSQSLAVDIHKSHAPVVAAGHSDAAVASIDVPDTVPYVVSVLPDSGYTLGGATVAVGQAAVIVIVNSQPVPTAQISILAFHDNWPINNAPEVPVEAGLAGFTVIIADAAGQVSQDAFGNPLGTAYAFDPNTGGPLLDPNDGTPVVETLGNGNITTNELGEALIKFIAPGKYGVQLIPPDNSWIQTSTIEGTHTIDAWVKPNEPPVFVEFGPAAYHVFVGFVQAFDILDQLPGDPMGTISGRLVYNHFAAPPQVQGFFSGPPVEEGWVGLNEAFSRQGVYAQPCAGVDTGDFTITGVPAGTYQLVTWDQNLDSIFGFNSVTIPDLTDPNNPNWNIDLGDVLVFRWFGTLEGSVFFDADKDGFRDPNDPGESGIPGEALNLRFRDGTIYQATATDVFGDYSFSEVFPFFKWLVVEVGFARLKDTGFTNIVDAGGEILPDAGWAWPSRDKLNPQEQLDPNGVPIINPNTGNAYSRTEAWGSPGSFLLQAMQLYLNQTNVIDWGKSYYDYAAGENGGITGIVYYAVTRAEDDPRYAVGEEWEPGIPRLQVNLYVDQDYDGIIDDLDGDPNSMLADRDNYPLGWIDDPYNPAAVGPEDVDWNGNGLFEPGDAIQITYTDSWDENPPTGCIQNIPIIHGEPAPECFDNFGTWNQIRPGVFDGGYAFASHFRNLSTGKPGMADPNAVEVDGIPQGIYIVEAAQPNGYELVKEEDKNVDYGNDYIPSILTLPPACVGDDHTVPDFLALFGDIEAPFAGEVRPLCDRKQVFHAAGQNSAADFFFFTEVPKAARAVGFINNDLAAEFNATSPVFGEKQAPSWIPISFQDYAGNEITRVYCDEFGAYNALLPSSFSVNLPSPSGVSPHMISMVLNHPGPIPDPEDPTELITDPWFDASFSQTPYTFNFESGKTTYLDTPVIPVAAFAGYPTRRFDVEPPSGTPMIRVVNGPSGGPVVCGPGEVEITIRSLGNTSVPDPDPGPGGGPFLVRDYGFGNRPGQVTVGGVPLEIDRWNRNRIVAIVDTSIVSTGQLLVQRRNGPWSPLGVTLHVLQDAECDSVVHVSGGAIWPDTPIQDAIDTAAPGALIVVGAGDYRENPIIYKNVKLQGSGLGTIINGNPVPFERVTAWHAKINEVVTAPIDVGIFEAIEAPCLFVHANADGTFTEEASGLIDGFTIMGGVSGGGIYLAGYAQYFDVSNNKITNNQGTFGGAITVGISDNDGANHDVNIHNNMILKNGGINGGGGVTIFRGSDNYTLADNIILGNFTRNVGGGVAHIGLSDGGTIARNQIAFNEVFYGAQIGGDGGGVYIGGTPNAEDPADLGDGAGSVTVLSNLIQGNLAGSGSGGGLRALLVNGQDVVADPGNPDAWYSLNVFNNMVVNNVAALRGGGIALQDTVKANIIHNTIANNDCTATAALAFPPGNLQQSNPQGAGVVATPHSAPLALVLGAGFSNPNNLKNNIVWHNRSFYWDGTLNDNLGGLVAAGYWDLQVVGPGSMNPLYCILTDATGYDSSNIAADPTFETEYFNGLLTAAVLDEGGNSITVRYMELSVSDGDYHIQSGSPAEDSGQDGLAIEFGELGQDFDGQDRSDTGVDVGADEIVPAQAASGSGGGDLAGPEPSDTEPIDSPNKVEQRTRAPSDRRARPTEASAP